MLGKPKNVLMICNALTVTAAADSKKPAKPSALRVAYTCIKV